MAKRNDKFTFDISLSVLNHLGRNLYRSFLTILGEAVSNSWDADATNVWIYIDKKKGNLLIKDDGSGMNRSDFQTKFLRIGYSKRKFGITKSKKDRPYIGRKGIGKLALLSCADRITVITKKTRSQYVGGVIDNSGLDKAIKDELKPQQYKLGKWDLEPFKKYTEGHSQGTIIYFENVRDGIRNNVGYIKKCLALYFRFSLLDDSFNIWLNGKKITTKDINDLARKTEFLWSINENKDPYVKKQLTTPPLRERRELKAPKSIHGFIATVNMPKSLKILTTDEKVSVDLFVNGRLREKDLLKHIPSARIVENYLYGQIHVNALDDGEDRFTSSREGIIADDAVFKKFLVELDKMMKTVIEDWDELRRKYREDGDPDNPKISKKARKSSELYNAVSEDYIPGKGSSKKEKIETWIGALAGDAQFNFSSYAECFISENLVRKYIEDKKISLSKEAKDEIKKWKETEERKKNHGNLSIDIRQSKSELSYLSMDNLAYLVDKRDPIKEACLARDANEYEPIRDALAHTSLLTDVAKSRLTSVYENIKGRLKKLLSSP